MGKRLLKTATAGLVVASGIATITCTNTVNADEVEGNTSADNQSTATVNATTQANADYKSSEQAKAELDTQTGVVTEKESAVNTAQEQVNQAQTGVNNAQTTVDSANQAVTDAEKTAANATPENIEANKAQTADNLADQKANASNTAEVDQMITDVKENVNNAQTSVDTAQANKDQADKAVDSATANVDSAQAAISGTGLENAKTELENAKADVTEAEKNVSKAEDSLETAKKADSDTKDAIAKAETDVNTKKDTVNNKRDQVTSASDKVTSATDAVNSAQTKVNEAQKELDKNPVITIPDSMKNLPLMKDNNGKIINNLALPDGTTISGNNLQELFHSLIKSYRNINGNYNGSDKEAYLKSIGLLYQLAGSTIKDKAYEVLSPLLQKDDTPIDLHNVTYEQQVELSQFVVTTLNTINHILNDDSKYVTTTNSIKINNQRAQEYVERNTGIDNGHIALKNGQGYGENMGTFNTQTTTMSVLKTHIFNIISQMYFNDIEANINKYAPFGHLLNFTGGGIVSVAFAPIASTGETLIDLFGNYIISWLMMPQINSALNSNRFLRLR